MRHGCEENKFFKADLINENETSSSSSEDDEDAELLTEDVEKGFFKVLGHLKKKDPKIYQQNVQFYSVEEQNSKKKRLDKNYKNWLRGKKIEVEDNELKKDLGALHDVWSDPNLSKDDQFLRDYILNEKFLELDESFDVEKELDKLSEEEKELQEELLFEEKYNCRFEKPDEEFLKKYPHSVGKSVEKKRKSDSDSQLKVKKIKKKNMEIDKEVVSNTSKHNRKSKNKVKQLIENELQQRGTKIYVKPEPGENEVHLGNREGMTTVKIKSKPVENEIQRINGEEMKQKNEVRKSIKYPNTTQHIPLKKKRKRLRYSQIKVEKNWEEVECDRKDEQNGKSTSTKFFSPPIRVGNLIKGKVVENSKINIKSRPDKKKTTEKNGEVSNQANTFGGNEHTLAKLLKNKKKNRSRALRRKRIRESKAEIKKTGDSIEYAGQREKMAKKEEPQLNSNQHNLGKPLKNKKRNRSKSLKRKRLKESKTEIDNNENPMKYVGQRENMSKKEEPRMKDESKKENDSETLIKDNINLSKKKIKQQKNKKRNGEYSTKREELVNKNLNELIIKEGFSLEKMIPRKKMRHRALKIFPDKFNKLQKCKEQKKPLQESGMKKKKRKTTKVLKKQENE